VIDDNQQDVNGFVNLGWRHRFDPGIAAEAGRTSELFAGGFFRDGSLNYTPGLSDDPTFVFFPDTTHYILSEDRNFHTAGLKLDYTLQPHHGLELKGGVPASYTGGHENFASVSKTGSPGPTSDSGLQGGVAASPTLPERDDFYEVGYVHRFPVGIVTKLSAYHKRSSPGIDDNTVPGSAIVTSVNIEQVRITGIEGVVEIRPRGPVSGYVNLGLNHAWGDGAITGGFFPDQPPSGKFDLDHDQRLSGVASVVYSSRGLYVSATGIY